VSQATGYRLQAEWKIRVNDEMDNLFGKMKNYSPIIGIHSSFQYLKIKNHSYTVANYECTKG